MPPKVLMLQPPFSVVKSVSNVRPPVSSAKPRHVPWFKHHSFPVFNHQFFRLFIIFPLLTHHNFLVFNPSFSHHFPPKTEDRGSQDALHLRQAAAGRLRREAHQAVGAPQQRAVAYGTAPGRGMRRGWDGGDLTNPKMVVLPMENGGKWWFNHGKWWLNTQKYGCLTIKNGDSSRENGGETNQKMVIEPWNIHGICQKTRKLWVNIAKMVVQQLENGDLSREDNGETNGKMVLEASKYGGLVVSLYNSMLSSVVRDLSLICLSPVSSFSFW